MDKYVTNRQLFFIFFITLEAYSVIELPKTMSETAGTGFWIPITIATIFFMFAITIIASLNKMFPDKTLFDYSSILIGKIATWIISAIYAVYFIFVIALIKRSVAEIIQNSFLPKTPMWAGMFLMLAICGYAASRGLGNIGRIFEFFGFITIASIIFLEYLVFSEGEFIYLRPFFDSSEIMEYVKALPMLIMPYLGIEILTVIPFSSHMNVKAPRYCRLAILSVGICYIITVATTFMIISIDDTKNYSEPLIRAIRRVDIPSLQIFQRLDVIFIAAWFFAMFCSLTILIFSASSYINKMLPKLNMTLIIIFVCISSFIIGLIPHASSTVSQLFIYLTQYFGFVPAILIPAVLLIIAKVKKNAGKLP